MGRVRFLRAGLVTLLPGGLGIGPAGTMTGARGASLWVRSVVRVTPVPYRSPEAWPGLSRGIDLRGKYRSRSAERRARPQRRQAVTFVCVVRDRARSTFEW